MRIYLNFCSNFFYADYFLRKMKCQFCDSDATMHLKQVLKDEALEMHLCEECAEERGITDPSGFALQNLLGGEDDKIVLPELKELPSCAECGFSFQDLKKVGRLGCAKCYSVFSSEIVSMLGTMHRGITHTGKKPEGMVDLVMREEVIAETKVKLKEAIDGEDFELAARLRDEIKEQEAVK